MADLKVGKYLEHIVDSMLGLVFAALTRLAVDARLSNP